MLCGKCGAYGEDGGWCCVTRVESGTCGEGRVWCLW